MEFGSSKVKLDDAVRFDERKSVELNSMDAALIGRHFVPSKESVFLSATQSLQLVIVWQLTCFIVSAWTVERRRRADAQKRIFLGIYIINIINYIWIPLFDILHLI